MRLVRIALCPSGHATARLVLVLFLAGLSGCASQYRPGGTVSFASHRYSPPPGPPDDPWGPYISEASARFGVPPQWIRAVMRQESGGQEDITSSAGAMGLMQVMPATYAQLAARYGLGDDPYEPHDNMLAGVAYLREMYERYGSPGFLAAYNAGPGRVDQYLAGNSDLPDETVNYVAAISPHLGNQIASSGPFGAAAPASVLASAASPPPGGRILVNAPPCDPNAAYDPDRFCQDVPAAPVNAAAPPCDPDAAYDPRRSCVMLPQAPDPPPVLQLAAASSAGPVAPGSAPATWSIQVGTYAQQSLARDIALAARASLPDLLGTARIALPQTTPFGGAPLYRARLTPLSQASATQACARLTQKGLDCLVVPPGQG